MNPLRALKEARDALGSEAMRAFFANPDLVSPPDQLRYRALGCLDVGIEELEKAFAVPTSINPAELTEWDVAKRLMNRAERLTRLLELGAPEKITENERDLIDQAVALWLHKRISYLSHGELVTHG